MVLRPRLKHRRKDRFHRCPKCHKLLRKRQKRCTTCHVLQPKA
jgi:hypothetical protein